MGASWTERRPWHRPRTVRQACRASWLTSLTNKCFGVRLLVARPFHENLAVWDSATEVTQHRSEMVAEENTFNVDGVKGGGGNRDRSVVAGPGAL